MMRMVFAGQLNFEYTVFAVVRETDRENYASILSVNYNDNQNCWSMISNNGRISDDHWQPCGRRTTSTVINLGECTMLTWVCPDWETHYTSSVLYKNGTEADSSAWNTTSAQIIKSGSGGNWKVGNWQESRTDMEYHAKILFLAFKL